MTRSTKQPRDILAGRRQCRDLNSPRLKPTPDLTGPLPTLTPDELEDARALFAYEESLRQRQPWHP